MIFISQILLLHKIPNVQECDATGDAQRTYCRVHKKLLSEIDEVGAEYFYGNGKEYYAEEFAHCHKAGFA